MPAIARMARSYRPNPMRGMDSERDGSGYRANPNLRP